MSTRKIYRVYGAWQIVGYTDVNAETPEEAVNYVEGTDAPTHEVGSIEDSFQLDKVEERP